MWTLRTSLAMLMFAGASGCVLFRDPMTMQVVRGGRSKPIDVILDSPEVRQMVAVAEAEDRR
jgi:hypothetical protein